ncbi:hypothetical protein M378DRAFT_382105 [Amanita muscaria Koide BX008]|uniref:Secreted protein n=1 Tax=Amanita muscaria (strain Koide BX008) TaxID=946122 RepID=A0A0C2S481_AMAMK|nr:hypothetical protein M378DRAFT_382105 [Amanita muscaria Koide BX008]
MNLRCKQMLIVLLGSGLETTLSYSSRYHNSAWCSRVLQRFLYMNCYHIVHILELTNAEASQKRKGCVVSCKVTNDSMFMNALR